MERGCSVVSENVDIRQAMSDEEIRLRKLTETRISAYITLHQVKEPDIPGLRFRIAYPLSAPDPVLLEPQPADRTFISSSSAANVELVEWW